GTFRDIDLVPRPGQHVGIMSTLLHLFQQELARRVQRLPGRVILGVADPDRKIVVDPASCKEPLERVARWILPQKLTYPNRFDARVARNALVERSQEGYSAVWIVFPAVFAVQDDRGQCGRISCTGRPDGVQLGHEVPCGHGSRTSLV